MRTTLFLLMIALVCLSCNKENIKAGEVVEIYLLKNYQPAAGKCEVDASVSTLRDTPVIKNQDIIGYSKNNYQFILSAAASEKIKAFTDHEPFAITVDKKIIYYAIYKPAISSSSCENSITMANDPAAGNKILLRIGYPGPFEGVTVDDQRNNPTLIATLKNQGKLQ